MGSVTASSKIARITDIQSIVDDAIYAHEHDTTIFNSHVA
jgi:hypothetical protein